VENDKSWKIDRSEIEIGQELGRGAFGVVYRCTWRSTECVIKLLNINNSNEAAINAFIREAHNVKNLRNHANICSIYGICPDPTGIVMEFVPGGSLLSCLANNRMVLTPKKVVQFAREIASGMRHLHAENIIHLDLACRNLLVTFAENDVQHVKITDFGLSRIMESDTYKASSDANFPVRWTAPETLNMGLISRGSDVWSFGVTMWELIERKIPYYELTTNQVLDYVTSGKRLPRPTKVEIPDSLWELMQQCWNLNPDQRPSFAVLCDKLKQIELDEFDSQQTTEYKPGNPSGFFVSSDALTKREQTNQERANVSFYQEGPQQALQTDLALTNSEAMYGNNTSRESNDASQPRDTYNTVQQQPVQEITQEQATSTGSDYGNAHL